MYKKYITIFLIFVIALMCFSSMSWAMSPSALFGGGDMASVANGVTDGFDKEKGIGGALNTVIALLQVAGTGVSLIMVTMLGIKYLLASVEEKAEIKKTAAPIVIGAVLLFGAVQIIAAVEDFSNNVLNK